MFKELIPKIARSLDSENVPYMIIGGQAVLHYGEPRFTRDIDINLGVDISALQIILSVISKLSLSILVKETEDFAKKTMVLPAIDESSGIRVDFIFFYSVYERQAIKRARKVAYGQILVNIASLEDVVIHKIIAGRPRDVEDIRNMLLKNTDYNKKYILKWLKQFDVSLDGAFIKAFGEIEKELSDHR